MVERQLPKLNVVGSIPIARSIPVFRGGTMRELVVAKGERQRVLHMLFDSIPQKVGFTAEPVAEGGSLSGTVEVQGSRWLFRKPPSPHALAAENVFDKSMWDSRYAIYVTPDEDVRIRFETRHVRAKLLFLALGGVVVAAVAAVAVMAILRSAG